METILNNVISLGAIGGAALTLANVNDKFNPFKFMRDMRDESRENNKINKKEHEELFSSLVENKIETLGMKICSSFIPMEERLKAGYEYKKLGGNGSISIVYDELRQEYSKKIEKENNKRK